MKYILYLSPDVSPAFHPPPPVDVPALLFNQPFHLKRCKSQQNMMENRVQQRKLSCMLIKDHILYEKNLFPVEG